MSKTKKVLTMCAAYALTAAIAIGGTVAYLQDDASDDNVMVLGNVEIEQHEYERVTDGDGKYITTDVNGVNSYKLQEFTQDKPLYPIVGDPSASGDAYAGWDDTVVRMTQVNSYGNMQVFAGKNAQDKFVTVENTGKTDAYIRTLVAIEIGEADIDLIGTSHHSTWTKNLVGEIVVKGNNYYVLEFIYNGGKLSNGSWRHEKGVLPAGDTSYPSLSQVYLKSTATNADMEAIDGNDNELLDILVLSQAVQAGGFDSAKAALDAGYGESNVENATVWFEGVPTDGFIRVSTFAELKAAFATGGNIRLAEDITAEEMLVVKKDVKILLDMNGKTITNGPTIGKDDAFIYTLAGSDLTITGNGTFRITKSHPTLSCIVNAGPLTIENGNFIKDLVYTSIEDVAYIASFGGDLIIKGGYFDSGYYDDNVNGVEDYVVSKAPADKAMKTAIKNNTISSVNIGGGNPKVVIYGGTFVGFNPAWGDEGCMLPDNLNPNAANDGGFLEGQVYNAEELQLPDGYSYTVGETDDGRITYTINYSK